MASGGPVPAPLLYGASPVPQVQLAGPSPRTRSAQYLAFSVSALLLLKACAWRVSYPIVTFSRWGPCPTSSGTPGLR